ncbi:MAG TPA: endolytic transglycosylase MltG [Rubrobacteraceae bacterium]
MRRHDRARRRRERREIDERLSPVRPSGSVSKRQRRGIPKKPRSGRGSRAGVSLLVVTLLFVGVTLGAYLISGAGLRGEDEPVTVAVEQGDTLSSVAGKLEEAGVVGSSLLFELEARYDGWDNEIKPGEYRFLPGEESEEILRTLSSGDSISAFTITIPEGLTLEQTARVVEEESGVPAEEFEAAAEKTDYDYAFLDDPNIGTTEGFLFPKKYQFEGETSAEQIVDRLLEQYLVEKRELGFEAAKKRLNLTEYELVTVASLVEKESANPEERSLIAGVIYNRIRSGMPLQIDATIRYVLGKPKENLSLDDLEIESPYNTYKNRGLPPSPIASPSQESIRAALEPAETDYLYYVLEAGGKEHFFTDDYDEFLEAKEEAEEER